MNRAVPALAALLLTVLPVRAKVLPQKAVDTPGRSVQELLETSLKEKRSLSLRVKGQSIPGVVIRLFSASVEIRKPDRARVLIRLDRIESAALD